MDFINRYVYSVVSKLPENQREEIEKELRLLISDMMDEIGDHVSEEEKVSQVLTKLGDPSKLADEYRDTKLYLIGPKNFTKYIFVLKIVLTVVFIATTIGTLLNGFFVENSGLEKIFSDYFTNIFTGLLQGFAWVTIIFGIADYKGVELGKNGEWNINKLPEIPHKKAVIKKFESIVAIVFISIFTIIFYFFPEIIAFYSKNSNGDLHVISVFNPDYYNQFKIIILLMFTTGILKEILKLIYGRWCMPLSIYSSILTVISLVLFVVFFSNPHIWNPNFSTELANQLGTDVKINFDRQLVVNSIIKLVVFFKIIEIASMLYKGYKYDRLK